MLGFTFIVVTLFTLTLAFGRTPVLGLDLKGGLSVIYATAEPADEDELIVVRDLMRDQLESFGIAEPDVRVEGENIIVDLPGVSDQDEAFDALKVSGIVELRPVIQCQAGSLGDTTGSTVPGSSVPTDGSVPTGSTVPSASVPGANSTPPSDESASSAQGHVGSGGLLPRVAPLAVPDTTAPPASPTTVPTITPDTAPVTTTAPVFGPEIPTTAPPADTSGQEVLPYSNTGQVCLVGPAGGTGEVFQRGSAGAGVDQNQRWVVTVDLRDDGQATWNALAQQCFNGSSTCPSHQLAIVLDGEIQSAPTVQTPDFPGSVQISGSFTEDEVRDLARVLNRGAFPVTVVQQRVETVSPTAGQDALEAAIVAGMIGVVVMLIVMVLYYRKLAVVILSGLTVWGLTVFTAASFVSNQWNYALTLAGATGIIVSVGVTVDSYVVYFERIRDETRHGRSLANAAPRSFAAIWRTIVAADVVALLAAVVLFWLSVGSVKGFALYLGLTTICDLLVCYFFTRPATCLLAQSRWAQGKSRASAVAPIGATS